MKHVLSLLLISLTYFVEGQEGYLITLDGDSTVGEIKITQGMYYDEVKIKTNAGREMHKAFKLKSIMIDNEVYEPINYNKRKTIAKVLAKGDLSFYAVRLENNTQYTERVLYKNNNALVVSSIGFRGSVADFLDDCVILTLKIKGRELGYSDIDEIIDFYNNRCEPQAIDPAIEADTKAIINFSQLLFDITSRLENGEDVPDYMIEALEKYSAVSLDAEIKNLLSTLKKN
ncbi:hypothetical protein [Ekhidna sp.]|uniref:hypothetical protein n=1 Tax=Ekhidna sp. TaxID=2608089 RepID=UPI003297C657